MLLAPGTQLGPYEIVSLLGAGGMGEVYRARDTRLQREVAIKVRQPHLSDDPEMRKRLEREARAASALNHPHICTVYDVGEQQGCYFIAMELMDGCTLSRTIDGRPMPLIEVLRIAIQIVDALDAAHKRGIVHRDLKPSNIFVTNRGDAKLLDFGLAKQLGSARDLEATAATLSDLTSREEVLGTISYMSPEQAQGKEVDTRSDIFSYGAVLYEMSTGRRAFDGTSSASIYAAILRAEPTPAKTINPVVAEELQRIIGKALEKNPGERYQSANELMIDLRRLKRQMFDSSQSDTTPHTLSEPWWRTKTALYGSIVMFVLLTVLVISISTPAPVAELLDLHQITFSAERKDRPLLTDGPRLYFQSQEGPVEMSVNGGPVAPLRASSAGMHMLDVSRDGSELLAMKPNVDDEDYRGSLWSIPVLGGLARRIGNMIVTGAAWLPDGSSLMYTHLRSLFISGQDGTNPRKIWEAPGNVSDLSFSADGRRVRLTVDENHHLRLWELNVDGSNAHRLALKWPENIDQSSGRWTPDGRHFIFRSDAGGSENIYELIEPTWLQFWKKPAAVKLTTGEMDILDAVPSRDSKELYVLGRNSQGAMQVYDSQLKRFVPFLGGLSAAEFVISSNRQWMVYTDFPRHFLWRSKLDGSEKLQLTSSYAAWPRWSPDGKNIVYSDWQDIYVISSEGGPPEKLIGDGEIAEVGPDWTPDGKGITFNDFPSLGMKLKGVQVFDLASRKISIIPGSEGFYVGSWSPDGESMVAMAQNPLRMMLYNVQSQSWSELKRFSVPWGYWVWTRDSKAILFAQTQRDAGIYRLTVANRKWESVAGLEGIYVADQTSEGFLNLTADGKPAIMNDTSVVHVYSLKWKQ